MSFSQAVVLNISLWRVTGVLLTEMIDTLKSTFLSRRLGVLFRYRRIYPHLENEKKNNTVESIWKLAGWLMPATREAEAGESEI